MSASIRSQLDILERKISELNQLMGVEGADQPIDIELEAFDAPVFEAPSIVEEDLETIGTEEVNDVEEAPEVEANETEDLPEVEEEPAAEELVEEAPEVEDLPEVDEAPALILEPEEDLPASVVTVQEAAPTTVAVIDAMTEHQAWRHDMPASPVRDIRSAISLNDRLLFINTLFGHDAVLFQNTLCALNAMESLDEAINYLATNHPGWNLESDAVYRFMMAVRRKLK